MFLQLGETIELINAVQLTIFQITRVQGQVLLAESGFVDSSYFAVLNKYYSNIFN